MDIPKEFVNSFKSVIESIIKLRVLSDCKQYSPELQCHYYHDRRLRSHNGNKFYRAHDIHYDESLACYLQLNEIPEMSTIKELLLKPDYELSVEELDYMHSTNIELEKMKRNIENARQIVFKNGWSACRTAVLHIYLCYVCAVGSMVQDESYENSSVQEEYNQLSTIDKELCEMYLKRLPNLSEQLRHIKFSDMKRLLAGAGDFISNQTRQKK